MNDWFKETVPIFQDEKADQKKIRVFPCDTGDTPIPVKLSFKSILSQTLALFPHFAVIFYRKPKAWTLKNMSVVNSSYFCGTDAEHSDCTVRSIYAIKVCCLGQERFNFAQYIIPCLAASYH